MHEMKSLIQVHIGAHLGLCQVVVFLTPTKFLLFYLSTTVYKSYINMNIINENINMIMNMCRLSALICSKIGQLDKTIGGSAVPWPCGSLKEKKKELTARYIKIPLYKFTLCCIVEKCIHMH